MRNNLQQLPVLVWDVDDVLNDLTEKWFQAAGRKFRDIPYGELRANPPHEVLGISRGEYLASLDEFRAGNQDKLRVRPEVLAFFAECGCDYRHVALTAVPRRFAGISANWVLEHLGDWIRTFHFVPSPREGSVIPEYDTDKSGFLRALDRVDLFIDDSEKNIASACAAGFDARVFPCPWNTARGGSIAEFINNISNIG